MIVLTGLLAGCAAPHYRSALFDAQANEPYTLGSGDRLRIIVFGQDALSNSYSVDGSGHISMPLIGLVEAAGLTTAALERSVEARLRDGFLREPHVSVEVEAYRPFFMLGEVTTAGQYPFINGMTVENADCGRWWLFAACRQIERRTYPGHQWRAGRGDGPDDPADAAGRHGHNP